MKQAKTQNNVLHTPRWTSCLWYRQQRGDFGHSALLGQPAGVQVGHGSGLDLERLPVDVVAGELLAGLADGDGLAALAAHVDGQAALLPAHLLHHLQLLQRLSRVDLQVLHGLFTQSDDVHLLRLLPLWTDLRRGSHHVPLRDNSQVLDVSRWLREEREPGVGRLGFFCSEEVELLIPTWYKAVHTQLDLLLRAEGGLERVQVAIRLH